MHGRISDKGGKCQYCQRETNLIDAHIIAKSLHPSSSGFLWLVDKTGKIGKVLNNGWFDKNILCETCDRKIGAWEKLLKKFLRNPNYYDYQSVKLATLSIAWKAHITTHEEFRDINLEPYNEEIYELIKSKNPIREEEFPVWVNRYQPQNQSADGDLLQTGVLPGIPLCDRDGIKFVMFAFLGYQVIVKVDNQQLPPRYTKFIKVASSNIGILPYISSSSLTPSMQEVFLLPYIR